MEDEFPIAKRQQDGTYQPVRGGSRKELVVKRVNRLHTHSNGKPGDGVVLTHSHDGSHAPHDHEAEYLEQQIEEGSATVGPWRE